jgi:hypothetical protein
MKLSLCARSLIALAFLLCLAPRAAAQGAGVRVGASGDPDQFYVGAHVETGAIADRLHFRPNVEVGFGDGVTLVAINFEFAYKFPSRQPWAVYAGGGPALNLFFFDRNNEAEGGFNFMVGLEHRSGFFGEVKAGALRSPNVKLGVGIKLQ